MCLDIVTNRKPKNNGEGWKTFSYYGGQELYGRFYWTTVLRPKREWLKEKDFIESTEPTKLVTRTGRSKYPRGWHIWLKRPNTSFLPANERVKKVRYRGALVKGFQDSAKNELVVVAKEIFIIQSRERKRKNEVPQGIV